MAQTTNSSNFAGVSLDCAEPDVLADFYLALLGGRVLGRTARSVGTRTFSQSTHVKYKRYKAADLLPVLK
jgi:hypothetical protein